MNRMNRRITGRRTSVDRSREPRHSLALPPGRRIAPRWRLGIALGAAVAAGLLAQASGGGWTAVRAEPTGERNAAVAAPGSLQSAFEPPYRSAAAPQNARTGNAAARSSLFQRLATFGGVSNVVALDGDRVLLGSGARILMFDRAAPDLVPVAQVVLPSTVTGLAVQHPTALVVVSSRSVHLLDIADPDSPRDVGAVDVPDDVAGDILDINVAGDIAFVAGPFGVAAIRVADPLHPRWLGVTADAGPATAIAVAGNRLVTTGTDALVTTFGMSPTGSITRLGSLAPGDGSFASGVAMAGTHAYVTERTYQPIPLARGSASTSKSADGPPVPGNVQLKVIDIADPSTPRVVGTAPLDVEFVTTVAVAGARLFVLGTVYTPPRPSVEQGLTIALDVSVPADPIQLWTNAEIGGAADVAADGERLYVAERDGGVHVWHGISDSSVGQLVARYDVPARPRAVAAGQERVAIGDNGTGAVWTVNAANPPDLARAASSDDLQACWAECRMRSAGTRDLLADFNQGLLVIDGARPDGPRALGRADARGAVSVDAAGHFAFVITQQSGTEPGHLLAFDLTTDDPTQRSDLTLTTGLSDVAVAGGRAFVTSPGRLTVVDVSQPDRPWKVGEVAVGTRPRRVAVQGDVAYVVDGDGTLHVIDAQDPARPKEIGALEKAQDEAARPNNVSAVALFGSTLYVAHWTWLQAVDVREPARPRELGWAPASELGAGIGISDMAVDDAGVLYLISPDTGLLAVHAGPAAPSEPVSRLSLPVAYR